MRKGLVMNGLAEARTQASQDLQAREEAIKANGFDLDFYQRYTLADVFVKVRNHFETEDNKKRSLMLAEKIKYDVAVTAAKTLEDINVEQLDASAAKDDLEACLKESKEFFSAKEQTPSYEKYADGESASHMPRYRYVDEIEQVYLSLYSAFLKYNFALAGEAKNTLSFAEFNSSAEFSAFLFEHIFAGKHSKFEPEVDLKLLAKLEQELNA